MTAVAAAELNRDFADRNAELVTIVAGKPVTHGDLRAAFEAVQDPADWKAPISRLVVADVGLLTAVAVEYFHGKFPDMTMEPYTAGGVERGGIRIVSAGYVG